MGIQVLCQVLINKFASKEVTRRLKGTQDASQDEALSLGIHWS